MLVSTLAKTSLTGRFTYSFLISHNRIRLNNINLTIFSLQIVKTNFNMKFTTASYDMFSTFTSTSDDQWVRLT
jgi:hypothetical protein